MTRTTSLFVIGAVLAGCHGQIEQLDGDEFDDPEVAEACAARTLPDQPLRRLSSRQWANVIRDLFGASLAEPLLAETLFPPTEINNGFTNDAAVNTVNTAQSYLIEDEAARIATRIAGDPEPWLSGLLPCGTATEISSTCIDTFIRDFGRRAYRRPLADDEVTKVRALFDSVVAQSPKTAWAAVVQFFVQSPSLLYRIERGNGVAGPGPSLVELGPYEVASRLSFLFLDSGPDDELFEAAERGELTTRDQLAAQARRLIADPRFAKVAADFHSDWLHLYEIDVKAPAFSAYTPAVKQSHAQEVGELTRYILEAGGTITDVLGTPTLPVDATLAAYYGVPAPASGWAMAELPGRRGILTLGSVQSALAATDQTQLFHRASLVYHDVLCGDPLGFPNDAESVDAALSGTSGLPTARQRNEPTNTNGECAGCHTQLNPIAFAFENFDAAGAFRDQENGVVIDASGSIDVGAEAPVSFANAAQLTTAISTSSRAQRCYALQWFRASNGRSDAADDRCSTAQLQSLVRTHGGDLRELMVALTQVDAFRFRTTED